MGVKLFLFVIFCCLFVGWLLLTVVNFIMELLLFVYCYKQDSIDKLSV